MLFSLFHILKGSLWPFYVSVFSLVTVSSCILFFKFGFSFPLLYCLVLLSVGSFAWWKDVSVEGVGGEYSEVSVDNLKLGMVLFIFSEVCFFSGFFWSFFHYSLSPSGEMGSVWAPLGVFGVNPFSVPLLNTAVLLSSGVTVTWAHMQLVNNESAEFSLLFTLVLGVYFTFLQLFEYKTCSFSISDSVFGSIFFIATGFHGVHVVVGSVFLGVCVCRMFVCHFTCVSHLGFELAIWYWHFVDVVWLFLFSFIYWWGY